MVICTEITEMHGGKKKGDSMTQNTASYNKWITYNINKMENIIHLWQ